MYISGRTNVAAGARNDNVLAGQYIEFPPRHGFIQYGLTSDLTAVTADDFSVDVVSGTDIIARALAPRASAAQPVYPDDFHLSDAVAAGDRQIIGVSNKNAGAKNLFWSLIYDIA